MYEYWKWLGLIHFNNEYVWFLVVAPNGILRTNWMMVFQYWPAGTFLTMPAYKHLPHVSTRWVHLVPYSTQFSLTLLSTIMKHSKHLVFFCHTEQQGGTYCQIHSTRDLHSRIWSDSVAKRKGQERKRQELKGSFWWIEPVNSQHSQVPSWLLTNRHSVSGTVGELRESLLSWDVKLVWIFRPSGKQTQ